MVNKKFILVAGFSILGTVISLFVPIAQAEAPLGAVAVHQALLDLGTDLRLMCVAAHPDDEDGASLTYYRKKYGYKTFALIATRGEGGQNEIGSELYEELGVLRTHEMANASNITGAELHFLDYPEFGYSKSADEAFSVWGKEEALRRMVRKIRELKPDVIITHHGETGGHGHHQAVGRALMQSFDLAGDPKAFPEQLKEGLEPWQPARLYLRAFSGASSGGIVEVPYSELEPMRGMTYAKMAADALREHETQGMGFFIDRFLTTRSKSNYRLMKEAPGGTQGGGSLNPPSEGLFEGLKDRVSSESRTLSEKGLNELSVNSAFAHLKWAAKSGTAEQHRANELAVAVAELRLRPKISDTEVTPGQKLSISAELAAYGIDDVTGVEFSLRTPSWMSANLSKPVQAKVSRAGFATAKFDVTIGSDQTPTIPHDEYLFKPHFLEPQFEVVTKVTTSRGVVELVEPILIDVAPQVSISYSNAPYLIQQGKDTSAAVQLLVTNHTPGPYKSTLSLAATKGLTLAESSITLNFAKEGEQQLVTVEAKVTSGIASGDYTITATVDKTGYTATGTARVVDLLVPKNKNVGVIYSYDDTFMDTLERMGVAHEALEIDDFTADRLDEFTTIIVDIRAYLVRPDLVANNQTLLDYVYRGGSLIVMYQKTFEWNKAYAPYSLQIGRNRVTVEDAPITVLVPDHPLFTTPNKMGSGDWDGWRQERGLYFPSRWADEYTALIDVQDPGEKNPPGSCLVADYGDGKYMYTALGWYRQLRDLHPGTLRIFANMLAL